MGVEQIHVCSCIILKVLGNPQPFRNQTAQRPALQASGWLIR